LVEVLIDVLEVGITDIEKYFVPLTTKEIEAEYDYISF